MRVLHLVASSRGGGAAHVRDLAAGLSSRGLAVEVAMPDDEGHLTAADLVAVGACCHRVDIASGFSPAAVRHVRRLSAGLDILHVHGARAALFGRLAWAHMARWSGARSSRPASRPRLLYTIHGLAAPHYPGPRRLALLAAERWLAPLTDGFVAVCQAEADAVVAARIARPERVHIVRNGIHVRQFQGRAEDRARHRAEFGVPVDATLVTTVCRLDRPRDLGTLLEAFQRVAPAHPTAHLLVVGDGPLRAQVERQIAALSLRSRISLIGWRREVRAVHAATDIFTLTTWGWEGLPLTVLEAMAAGAPVVATRAGGIPEAVVGGETGLLVGTRDVDALAGALHALLEDRAERRRLGAQGRERAEQHFTADRMVEETTAVYERVLTASGPAPRGGRPGRRG